MRGVCPQIAGSELRNRKAECGYKFVSVLLAVCTLGNALNPGSPRIAFLIIRNFLKALRDFDRGSSKVWPWIRHVGELGTSLCAGAAMRGSPGPFEHADDIRQRTKHWLKPKPAAAGDETFPGAAY
jgi:hypothetical protein